MTNTERVTADGSEIRRENQLRLVVYLSLSQYSKGFIHPRWLALGFLLSTVSGVRGGVLINDLY